MKFAKELEQDLVPEWRIKYLDYKAGKKKVKAVAKAVAKANATPRLPKLTPRSTRRNPNSPFFESTYSPRDNRYDGTTDDPTESIRNSPAPPGADSRPGSGESSDQNVTTPLLVPRRNRSQGRSEELIQYGSFVATPPSRPSQLELPDPALQAYSKSTDPPDKPDKRRRENLTDGALDRRPSANPPSAYEVGKTTTPPHRSTIGSLRRNAEVERTGSIWSKSPGDNRPFIKRLLSNSEGVARVDTIRSDVNLEAIDLVRSSEKEFFRWMDCELEKVETFYKSKEEQAGDRLKVLREQLHEMRNRRIDEIADAKRSRESRKEDEHAILNAVGIEANGPHRPSTALTGIREQAHAWMDPIERAFDSAKVHAVGPRPGPNSKALQQMSKSPALDPANPSIQQKVNEGRDYVRKPNHEHDVPYRSAKQKLKLALKEFYRGLELLKSYALLNRTAFRKINKKYDKAVNARPPLRYMEKVNKAWFVQSHVLDGHLHAAEDLYARYFERGNHKIAIGKLRGSNSKPGEHDGSAFRSGLLIGTGAVFGIQGLIYAADDIYYNNDPVVQVQTSYLLQIYGGYFLALYLFSLFCVDCNIWARNRINYVFIFEFDPRNHLDWRQLSEFPAFLTLVLGLFVWVNFSRYGAEEMYIYYPVILIFFTALLIFFPAPVLFHRSRRWFVYSHWRLLLAGLYPVEFRDFFLGDMYCSLTYFTANIELFFCLYAQHWTDPSQCNSTHSRLLGFFSTLPGIWRALQCLRRYYDTRSAFPHLANCGKYIATIMYYMTLSLYRISQTDTLLPVFITFAVINSIYTSIWDLAMDWSLCQPHAKKRFLRDVRGYKHEYYYYAAMILDPILRFNWIFYAIYTRDVQHNTVASFFVAFSEVTRRAMWTLLRVENEHCANVVHFKASRDVPLPYRLHESSTDSIGQNTQEAQSPTPATSPTEGSPTLQRHRSRTSAAEEGESVATGLRRRPIRTLTSIFANAHTQDFEKKRQPAAGDTDNLRLSETQDVKANSSDEDEDDEQDVLDMLDASNIMSRHRRRESNRSDRDD